MEEIVSAWAAEPDTWITSTTTYQTQLYKVIGWALVRRPGLTDVHVEPVIWDDKTGPKTLSVTGGWYLTTSRAI